MERAESGEIKNSKQADGINNTNNLIKREKSMRDNYKKSNQCNSIKESQYILRKNRQFMHNLIVRNDHVLKIGLNQLLRDLGIYVIMLNEQQTRNDIYNQTCAVKRCL